MAKKPTPGEMAAHVYRIARENGIQIIFKTGSGGRAWKRLSRIAIGPVKSIVTYAIAMHELGHVLGEHQNDDDIRLIREAYAWKWAFENALPGAVNDRFENKAKKCLTSYYNWAKWRNREGARKSRRAIRSPKFPPSDHIFWEILGEIPA